MPYLLIVFMTAHGLGNFTVHTQPIHGKDTCAAIAADIQKHKGVDRAYCVPR